MTNTSFNADDGDTAEEYVIPWLGVVLLGIMILMAVCNLFVIVAYLRDEKIQRHAANLIILHLSIADFLVGVGSYSLPVIYELSNFKFTLGDIGCKLWMTLDFSCVVMSVAMILCASFDRYWMVTRTIRYSSIQTRGRIKKMIAVSWVSVFTTFGVLIIGWDALFVVSYVPDGHCEPGHASSIPASLLVSFITGYIPLLTIATLNLLIFISLWKRSKMFVEVELVSTRHQSVVSTIQLRQRGSDSDIDGIQSPNVCADVKISTGKAKQFQMERRFRRNVRAAALLLIVVVAFAICYLPFEIMTTYSLFCEGCVSVTVYKSLALLQWFNSCTNPIIYAATIKRFRENFKQLLCAFKNLPRV